MNDNISRNLNLKMPQWGTFCNWIVFEFCGFFSSFHFLTVEIYCRENFTLFKLLPFSSQDELLPSTEHNLSNSNILTKSNAITDVLFNNSFYFERYVWTLEHTSEEKYFNLMNENYITTQNSSQTSSFYSLILQKKRCYKITV
jgi:hypothetical protein